MTTIKKPNPSKSPRLRRTNPLDSERKTERNLPTLRFMGAKDEDHHVEVTAQPRHRFIDNLI